MNRRLDLPPPFADEDAARPFRADWRAAKSRAFDLVGNSTGGGVRPIGFWNQTRPVYANANLSIYSGANCNARCPFCIEEVRPASRGGRLAVQRRIEADDARYFGALDTVLDALAPLDPSVSITGGEASIDPRLPEILVRLKKRRPRKLVLTTNGSGLLAGDTLERVIDAGVHHLNISRAHWDDAANQRLMGFAAAPSVAQLPQLVTTAQGGGTQVRLSCVLLTGGVDGIATMREYLAFARRMGVRRVIFRELMRVDAATVRASRHTRFADRNRVALDPIYAALDAAADFEFHKQIVGYYYYVEVWRHLADDGAIDVVLEGADLARLEATRRADPALIHELVFHANGHLCSTWQPWDGVLGPPDRSGSVRRFP